MMLIKLGVNYLIISDHKKTPNFNKQMINKSQNSNFKTPNCLKINNFKIGTPACSRQVFVF